MKNNLQPWRKPYLIILTILTVICIFVGLGMHVFSRFSVLGPFSYSSKSSSSKEVSESITYDNSSDLSSIKLNIALGDVTIKVGNELSVDYSYPEDYLPEFSYKNGKFTVSQKDRTNIGIKDTFDDCYINITIPSDCNLSSVEADLSMGNLEIESLDTEKVDFDCSMGNIQVNKINCSSFDADCSMGNVSVYSGSLGDVKANCSMGNVELLNVTFEDGRVDCALGNITITGEYDNLKTDCGLGSVTVNGKTISD